MLGLVCRDGAGIQYLALFREAWPQLDAEVQLRYLQDAVPLTRLYEGKGIYCSICQRQRDWNIGQDQLASLVHRYRHDRR